MDRVVIKSVLTVALACIAFATSPLTARAEEWVDPKDLLLLSNPPTKKDTDNSLKMLKELPVQVKKGKFFIRAYSSEDSSGKGQEHHQNIKTEFFIKIVDGKTIMPEVRISF